MDPNSQQTPQTPPQSSMDYLNSIATTPPQKQIRPLTLWLLIGGVLVAVVIVILLILSAGSGSKDNLESFSARITALEDVSKSAQDAIRSSELRTYNSSLALVLADAKQGIADKAGKPDKKSEASQTVAAEVTELNATLEEARLNAVYDRTYAREITYAIKNIRAQMNILYAGTKSESLQTYLEKTDANLAPLETGFAGFNAD